jgi:hypothetical protein
MALVVKDRVKETTATTGTGTLTLAGAVAGFQSFTSVLSNGDTTYYAIFESSTGAFEVGLGTFTTSGTTLARTTILESSNAGLAINLTAGAADVFITQPAEKAVYLDASNDVTSAAGTIDISNFNNDSGYTTNTGTVTSVAVSAGTGISVSGSPITTSGTITVTNTQPHIPTNLTYTSAASTGTVNSSTGTNATLPAATTSIAGLLTSADKTKLDGIAAGAQVNVATNLGYTSAASTGTVTSSTGTNATLPAATASIAGLLTSADKTKLDGIQAGAQVNVATNLSVTGGTTAGPTINSSTGTNATLPTASGTASGVVTTNAQTFAGVKTFSSTITGSVSGNAGTATTLQTGRTINGTSFNGSVNITTANWGTARTVTIGNTGKSVNGSANVAWSLAEIGAMPLTGGTFTGNVSYGNFSITDVENITVDNQIISTGDTDTYLQFHAADQWRVVTGNVERFEINNSDVTVQSALKEKYVALSGTTPSIDVDAGGAFSLTTSGNTTFTFVAFTSGVSCGFILELTAGGTHTITWPASVEWAGGTAPAAPASGETNIYVFWSRDGGTTWYGVESIDAAA